MSFRFKSPEQISYVLLRTTFLPGQTYEALEELISFLPENQLFGVSCIEVGNSKLKVVFLLKSFGDFRRNAGFFQNFPTFTMKQTI